MRSARGARNKIRGCSSTENLGFNGIPYHFWRGSWKSNNSGTKLRLFEITNIIYTFSHYYYIFDITLKPLCVSIICITPENLPHFKIIHILKQLFLMYKTKNKSFEMRGVTRWWGGGLRVRWIWKTERTKGPSCRSASTSGPGSSREGRAYAPSEKRRDSFAHRIECNGQM